MATNQNAINLTDASMAIMLAMKTFQPVMLWGAPGIGKSDLIKGITEEMGGKVYDIRLSQIDPTDLRGVPYYNKDLAAMAWAPPVDLPTAEEAANHPIVTLFLDELVSAPPSVQAAAYQLVLDRKVGTYTLPKNVVIVAAGNREGDKGVTFKMPTPLANRMTHLELKVDFDSWFNWAVYNDIDRDVLGFLSAHKGKLNDFDPKSSSRAFATPRSWAFTSNLLKTAYTENTPEPVLTSLVAGTVGDGMAHEFMTYRKLSGTLPTPQDVLNGRVTTIDTKETSAHYALIVSLCYELRDLAEKLKVPNSTTNAVQDKWYEYADQFFRFAMTNFTKEMNVLGARMLIKNYKLPLTPGKLTEWSAWHKKYGNLIIMASSDN
jgi:hypothetical protein